jgi:hypothetical protein
MEEVMGEVTMMMEAVGEEGEEVVTLEFYQITLDIILICIYVLKRHLMLLLL